MNLDLIMNDAHSLYKNWSSSHLYKIIINYILNKRHFICRNTEDILSVAYFNEKVILIPEIE